MRRPKRTREEYQRGLPGYHDPTAGFAGSTPARSALTLRAVIAAVLLVATSGAAVFAFAAGFAGFGIAFVVLALISLGDLAWVLHRKRRGEPG